MNTTTCIKKPFKSNEADCLAQNVDKLLGYYFHIISATIRVNVPKCNQLVEKHCSRKVTANAIIHVMLYHKGAFLW